MLDAPPLPGDWVLIHMGFALEVIDARPRPPRRRRAMAGLELIGPGRGTAPEPSEAPSGVRRRFAVSGLVQGVGFRPFAYVTAAALALAGSVANTGDGVVVEVEGDPDAVREYGRRLRADAPPLAMVTARAASRSCRSRAAPASPSPRPAADGPARTLASPDVATCADCLRELRDPADRRYRHPFITCTNCGPRFTIITGLPYDRAATTMAGFAMCAACRAEYDDPADRRFHAQPIACPDCGPRLELRTADGVAHADPLRTARELLAAGRIVAVKGLGGYHLACDARNAGRGRRAAPPQATRRKAVRGDGRRPRRAPGAW